MTGEIRTGADLRASIVASRGGIERFDGAQQRLLDALVGELAKLPTDINCRAVADLMSMLPAPLAPQSDRQHYDLSRLGDGDLAELERTLTACVTAGPAPETETLLRAAREEAARIEAAMTPPSVIASHLQGSEMQRRLIDEGVAMNGELRKRVTELEAALWRLEHPAPDTGARPGAHQRPALSHGEASGEPSNVVPLKVDLPLEQRYPHLRDTDPVGRW
jgi:hypothetical protein